MRIPPPGTMCAECSCCPAAIYAGDDPICWECDEGKPCKRGVKSRLADLAKFSNNAVTEPKQVSKPDPSNDVEKQEVEEEAPMFKRTPEEIRRQIQEAPPEVTNRDLEKKFKLSSATVSIIRRGLTAGAVKNREKPIVRMAQKPKMPPKRVVVATFVPDFDDRGALTLSFRMSHADMDSYWNSLSIEQKGGLIELQMKAILNRASVPA